MVLKPNGTDGRSRCGDRPSDRGKGKGKGRGPLLPFGGLVDLHRHVLGPRVGATLRPMGRRACVSKEWTDMTGMMHSQCTLN